MTGHFPIASLIGGVELLERAIGYTLGSLLLVNRAALRQPTPCSDWDLRELLAHMNDSLIALQEAVDVGHVDLGVSKAVDPAVDPVAALRDRACALLGAWTNADGSEEVSIQDRPLTNSIVTSAGSLEIAVHGWDVAQACGRSRPIPASIAEELLPLAPLFVTEADRPGRFAAAVRLSSSTDPGDRLLAFLGRNPSEHVS